MIHQKDLQVPWQVLGEMQDLYMPTEMTEAGTARGSHTELGGLCPYTGHCLEPSCPTMWVVTLHELLPCQAQPFA